MKTIKVKCNNCEKEFNRPIKEYNRSLKNNKKMFCGRACSCKHGNKISPRKGNPAFLKSDNRQDQFSPFKTYISQANSKERTSNYGKTNITLEYLKKLWDYQSGICPYTRKQMDLPRNTIDKNKKSSPIKASLDRIDSSKGYVQGNVEFVCLSVNYAKNTFSREQMIEFFS
jgi:hypothetical protein